MKPEHGRLQAPLTFALDAWAEAGGVIMGLHGLLCYGWDTEEPGVAWTGPLWVHPDYRRQGIATKLIQHLRDEPGIQMINSKTRVDKADVTAMYCKMGRTIVDEDEAYVYWSDET